MCRKGFIGILVKNVSIIPMLTIMKLMYVFLLLTYFTSKRVMLPGTPYPSTFVCKTPFLKTLYGIVNTTTKNKFIKNCMFQTIFYRQNSRRTLHHCNVVNNEPRYSWGTENHKGVYPGTINGLI